MAEYVSVKTTIYTLKVYAPIHLDHVICETTHPL